MKNITNTLEVITICGLIIISHAVTLLIGYNTGKDDQPTYEMVGDDCIEDEEGFSSVQITNTTANDTTCIVTVEKIVRR